MAFESYLAELNEKHRKLDQSLHEELQHPSADSLKITELKKQKLRIKEQMERIRTKA